MIKLERGLKPDYLSDQQVESLTDEYAQTNSSVWNKTAIKEALLSSSHGKCAYCEANITEESKYLEVEHFRCKDDFPDKVVEWENLLPSCKRCNGRKGTYNVETDGMIINPYEVDPAAHIYFRNYRLRWRDDIGRRTIIDALYLNDTARMVGVRMELGEAICRALENIRGDLEDYLVGERTVRKFRKIFRGVEKLLREAQPESPFSALIASSLLRDPDYLWIKNELSQHPGWETLEQLELRASGIAMTE